MPMPMWKREPSQQVDPTYVHSHIPYRMRKQRIRTDFTTTVRSMIAFLLVCVSVRLFISICWPRFQLLWKTLPVSVQDGAATVSFDLSDSVTTFRAMADILTQDGLLGQGEALIDCQLPTYAEIKVGVVIVATWVLWQPLNHVFVGFLSSQSS
jgi:Alpha-2-macroglobulin family